MRLAEQAKTEDVKLPPKPRWQWRNADLPAAVSWAQRREETWLEAGVSSTILTTADIDALEIRSLDDISARVPSLANGSYLFSGNSILSIRGASAGAGPTESNNLVATFLDSFYLRQTPNIPFAPFDFESIEVIRGVSALTHGKDALGGVVQLTLRKPDLNDSRTNARVSGGNNAYEVSGYYSAALNPGKMGVSISGLFGTRNGGFSATGNDGSRGMDRIQLRTQFRFQDEGQLVDTALIVSQENQISLARSAVPGSAEILEKIGDLSLVLSPARLPFELLAEAQGRLHFTTLSQVRIAEALSLNILLNARYLRTFSDKISFEYIAGIHLSNNLISTQYDHSVFETISGETLRQNEHLLQELRLHFNYARWDSLIGFWFFSDSVFLTDTLSLEGEEVVSSYNQETNSVKTALYFRSEFDIGRGLYVLFGARFSAEAKRLGLGLNGNLDNFFPLQIGEVGWATATYQVLTGWRSKQHHLYLNLSKDLSSDPDTTHFGREVLRLRHLREVESSTIELGYKAEFSPRSRLGLSLYQTDYRHQRIHTHRADAFVEDSWVDGGFGSVISLEKARAMGAEIDWQYKASIYFQLQMGFAFNLTQYQSPTDTAYTGSQILHSPPFKYNIRLSGETSKTGDYSFFWLLDYRATGLTLHYFSSPRNLSRNSHLIDVRLLWRFPRQWELSLWLRNLSNAKELQNAQRFGITTIEIFSPGREFELTAEYRF